MNYKAIGIGVGVIVVLIVVQKNIVSDKSPDPSPVIITDTAGLQTTNTPAADNYSKDEQTPEFSVPKNEIKTVECEGFCGEQFVEALEVGYDFTEEEIELIEQNPQLFAEGLKASPEAIEDLLSSVFADEDDEQIQQKQHVAHIISNALSSEDKAILGDQLAASDVGAERRAALKLFSNELKNSEADLTGFLSILESESDPRILLQAINMSKAVSGSENKQRAVVALNQGISGNYSDYAIGRAIIAMAELNVPAPEVNQQILNGIQGYSDEIRSSALEALSITLDNRLSDGDTSSLSDVDYDMVFAIQQIVDDPYADQPVRNRAISVLNQINTLENSNQ
jgi:hypothetical protein